MITVFTYKRSPTRSLVTDSEAPRELTKDQRVNTRLYLLIRK